MKTKEQIENAEKMAEFLQDYIILAKTQKRLKDTDLVERQLSDLKDMLVNFVDKL